MINPLLTITEGLPAFDRIKPEHVDGAIDILLSEAYSAFKAITEPEFPADWAAMDRVFGVPADRLSRAWGAVSHLNSVVDTPELRAAYNKNMPRMSEFGTTVSSSKELFAKYTAINPSTLNKEQQRAHQLAMQGFILGGAELEGAAKERFASIQEEHSTLTQKFSENALDATDSFTLYVTLEELGGVPADVIAAAKDTTDNSGLGYKLTLKMPCYLPVMQFAKSSALREKLYTAYVTRASDQSNGDAAKYDNTEVIRKILALRQEEANLLGFNNHAEVSVTPKMATSPEEVVTFLRDFAANARPYAEADIEELRKFAAEELHINQPMSWDWAYISEKLKEAKYSYNEQEVKQYFPINKVLYGLFNIAESLFEIKISADRTSVWHPSVTFYRITRDGELVGQFYLDPTARSGKRGGAWMNDVRTREMRIDTGKLQTPVAYLVCNFADGVDGKPAYLTHDDVITLFHEFGHGLHHMLSQVNEANVSGINGVEWDAVELPSQFMENFCWEWNVIKDMTSHVDTGNPMPKELFDKMYAAKNFHAGWGAMRQMEMSMFDMILHMHLSNKDFMDVQLDMRNEFCVLKPPEWSRGMHTFSHIFAGGYSAGYYSYKWAEVLSADAYAAFEETNNSIETSRKYRKEILEMGGSRPAMDSFIAFRGRKPTPDALLRHCGMSK